MTISYLGRGDGRIAYDVQGSGPLVVCLPGMGDRRQVYRYLTPALVAAGFRVATADLRGHGDSDDGFTEFGDEATASDLLALVAELGGPALVVGNSMGAGAAVLAAAAQPDSVSGLVLIGPFVRGGPSGLTKLLLRLALLKPWGPAVWQAYYRRFYPGRPPADLDGYLHTLGTTMRRGGHWRSFQRTARAGHVAAEAALGSVTAPVLVVMGDKDPDWKDPVAEARWVADTLGGELVLVPSAGHYPMAEYPELVGSAVVAFARRVAARA